MKLQDLFIKHFIAKSFGWIPEDMGRITADDLDGIMYVEMQMNMKERRDAEKIRSRAPG